MNILYLHQHFSPPEGYGNNRSLELAQYWIENGNKVTVICGSGNYPDHLPFFIWYKTYQYNQLNVVRLNISYSHFYTFVKRIFSFLGFFFLCLLLSFKWKKQDVVYASSTPLTVGLLGIWHKKIFNTNFVFETVDLWPDVPIQMGIIRNTLLIRILYLVEKFIYNQSSHIVCLSEDMKKIIAAKNISSGKISVFHNGTNLHYFWPCPDKNAAKTDLGFAQETFIILYAGTIGQANNVRFLIDTASAIYQKNIRHIKFIILGTGNRKSETESYCQHLHLPNVQFTDPVPKASVKKYFDAADIGVVCFASYPVLETNSANKFFDYLASGLPVMINYAGWQKEYLEKYKAGESRTTSEDLSAGITELFYDDDKRSFYAVNARKLAENCFNRGEIAQKVLNIFYSVKSN